MDMGVMGFGVKAGYAPGPGPAARESLAIWGNRGQTDRSIECEGGEWWEESWKDKELPGRKADQWGCQGPQVRKSNQVHRCDFHQGLGWRANGRESLQRERRAVHVQPRKDMDRNAQEVSRNQGHGISKMQVF